MKLEFTTIIVTIVTIALTVVTIIVTIVSLSQFVFHKQGIILRGLDLCLFVASTCLVCSLGTMRPIRARVSMTLSRRQSHKKPTFPSPGHWPGRRLYGVIFGLYRVTY